jgi:hypothetical protein
VKEQDLVDYIMRVFDNPDNRTRDEVLVFARDFAVAYTREVKNEPPR